MAEPLTFTQLLDYRTGQNSQYNIQDAALSVLEVFFTQSPSFLAYQWTML